MSTPRRPNLFVVGGPRCGTTSMHAYLDAHPDVFMSPEKEPHYFSKDLTEECDRFHGGMRFGVFRNEAQYLWLFRNAGQARYLGEASVLYMYSKAAAAEIHAFNPDARIVCMVREPVSYLHSLHSLYLYHLDEDCRSFTGALALEPSRIEGKNLARTVRIPSLLHYAAMARFTEQIERYLALFPREQVHVVVQDDLAKDPEGAYRELLAFLDLKYEPASRPSFDRINPSKEPRSRALANYLLTRHPSMYEVYRHADFPAGPRVPIKSLCPLLPLRLQAPIFRILSRINTRERPREPLTDDVRERLKREYLPEAERLSELLDRDLVKQWGYTRD